MTVYSDLAATEITGSMGRAAGYLGWRFVVQIAKAPSDAVLGTMILGADPLTDLAWTDITGDCHGIQFQRGSGAGSRPGAGKLTMWIDNDSGDYDVTESLYHGPGTMIRVVLGSNVLTGIMFTGFTIEWNEISDANNKRRWIAVSAFETLALLGEVDNNALPSPVGDNETLIARLNRIVAAANFQFGYQLHAHVFSEPSYFWNLQSTDLASDMLTELYRTVDSLGLVATPHKNGNVHITTSFVGYVGLEEQVNYVGGLPVVADSIVTANDDDRLLGTIDVSRVGGTINTYANGGIQGRYQSRSTKRTDLITKDPGSNADLLNYATKVLGKAAQTYRVTQFEVDSLNGAKAWMFLQAVDIGTRCNVRVPKTATSGVTFSNYKICGYSMSIEPLNDGQIHVTATFETDTIDATSTYVAY